MRSWILNGSGQRNFLIDELKCPKSLDGIRNYSYPEKDGKIIDELPIKKDDDACDMMRYYFVNRHDPRRNQTELNPFSQFGGWK